MRCPLLKQASLAFSITAFEVPVLRVFEDLGQIAA